MSDVGCLFEALDAANERIAELEGRLPPEMKDNPIILGPGEVGATLEVTMGNWTGVPDAYDAAWKGGGAADLGTGQTYEVQARDAGSSITCVVTASNAVGSTTAPPSNAIAIA